MTEIVPEWRADNRTDAELRARWAELQKEGNRSRTEEEGRAIQGVMNSIQENPRDASDPRMAPVTARLKPLRPLVQRARRLELEAKAMQRRILNRQPELAPLKLEIQTLIRIATHIAEDLERRKTDRK